MFKKFLKSHFRFSSSEQSGILFLAVIIVVLLYLNYFSGNSSETSFQINTPELLKIQQEIDSLRVSEIERKKPKIYPFNPNFITDFKAYTLGMTPKEFDRLKAYREEGKWINSVTDFQKVTGVNQKWIDSISPYFKFPEWVTNPTKKANVYTKKEPSYSEKIDLNKATQEQLQEVSGIGEVLGARIIHYREKLGGFTADVQLYFVFGLNAEVTRKALQKFTVKTPKEIRKMNINEVSVSDIATLPGISFEQGKAIWEFVRVRNGIENLEELSKIEGITAHKLQLITLYLFAE
ncbi:MAG: helix-hairpin-helix domain-containing protein [Flavobacteriaceae bacterium]|nr:helix-hairpin-helix domain-containing protein [Flavobacteriaceae bacterium]